MSTSKSKPGLSIVDLAALIMRQERVGWSKAMNIAAERRAAAEARAQRGTRKAS